MSASCIGAGAPAGTQAVETRAERTRWRARKEAILTGERERAIRRWAETRPSNERNDY